MSLAREQAGPGEAEARLRHRLGEWLRSKCGAPAAEILSAVPLNGGYTNLTWRVSATVPGQTFGDDLQFVLRIATEGGVSTPDDLPLLAQFDLLKALEPTAVKAPVPLWFESDRDILGAQFLTMQPMGGETGPRYFPLDVPDRHERISSFVRTLRDIHAVDWQAGGFERILTAPNPEHCAQAALYRVMRCVSSRGLDQHPLARRATAWLSERLPPRSEVALVHGDSNLSNYRFEKGAVVGVLDWEMAMLSDPAWDVAFYCGAIPKFYADQSAAVQQSERERFLDIYSSETGRRIDDLPFWEVLFSLRAASGSQLAAMGDNRTPIYWQRLEDLTQ